MRILLVKLSSLGDVIHNLPVASDIRAAFPDATIDWVTEAPYAALVAQHPAVTDVLPIHLRAAKRAWFSPSAWAQLFRDKAALAARRYDLIIDTQGLLKSAVIGNWSNGAMMGFDAQSIREPVAIRWYKQRFAVSKSLHAVARNRALAASALGYAVPSKCDYGLSGANTAWERRQPEPLLSAPYAVLLHATSRADKRWPVESWQALGAALCAQGWHVLLPSGNDAEFAVSEAIASTCASASARRVTSLTDTAAMLAHAHAVVGTDTGLSHLAVARGRPTVGLYLTTQPALTGLYGERAINLGGGTRDAPATVSPLAVLDALSSLGVFVPVDTQDHLPKPVQA
jgi:heptosyltransferase I